MDPRLSDAAFRFFEAVASRCKWRHRYYHQSMDMLSFIASKKPGHSNAARYVDGPVELGYLVDIHVPSETGGRHKRYLTVACTPADRTGKTLADIAAAAKEQKVRGASESEQEIVANDDGTTHIQTSELPGRALRSSDALPHNTGEAIRNPDVSIRNPDVSIRNSDALTLDKHFRDSKGGVGGARPLSQSVGGHGRLEQEATPHSPPPVECELQHKSVEGGATKSVGLSREAYAIYRSWWPGLEAGEADGMLNRHLKALTGDNPVARLEHIILSLKDEHASGDIKWPGKVVEHRVKHANSRVRAGTSATCAGVDVGSPPFKRSEILGRVGFGDKVTAADAKDILAAVPESEPDTVRRLIRKVCGKWAGQKDKSAEHVVAEVTRLLHASNEASDAEQPTETIRVEKPTKSAQDDAAAFAALRKQMPSTRSVPGA